MVSGSIAARTAIVAALVAAVWTPLLAGEVYGKITLKGASVGDGATVAARCDKRSYPANQTDKSGSYHLIVGESGKCALIITYEGQSASLDMVSHEDEVQYDIDLEMKGGKLAARRR